MKSIKAVLLICLLGVSTQANAQFLKKLKKRAEEAAKETISRKIENKTAEKTGEVMDTILNGGVKLKKKKHGKKSKSKPSNQNSDDNTKQNLKTNSNKDFVAGTKVMFLDTFKNDAIGDFPVTWNTNSSGEVITFNDSDSRWLQLDIGAYTPDGITEIPENCTFEFDLTISKNFDWYSDGITLNIVAVKDRRKDFMKWNRFGTGANGVRLRLKPKNFEYTGETTIQTYQDNDKLIENKKNNALFTIENNRVHVSLWRQKTRLRVYLNDKKVWDIPRAFGTANYNSIVFNTSGKEGEHFFVSNLRLAIAGKDMRHALLETGKFVTNDILFDINKAIIKSSSFKVLDELGQTLADNPDVFIKIIGHTDSDGSAIANQLLSKKRAEAIKVYLSDNFPIAGKRMLVIGKGESEPITSNATSNGKAKNRRVEFVKINQ
ncbi:OmpA family protein [Lutibacter sp.]|uniref:OmpA family protein n=1 Tax=Lutibacter sp. TaxID=1925666 RepID=UPI0025BD7AB4|nr:OmpA family protein [Lutibacter sp.]MCF6168827.1 OmpA family protein [Lutibacter sp.]